MAFKDTADFLRYLTLGARGCAAIARYLTEQQGHRITELERYTMSNKIWTTKIKRLRLPDLMCLNCGVRVEARAKSELEIKVSHSDTPGREWDAGLRDNDSFAFIRCVSTGGTAQPASQPVLFRVADMRATRHLAKLGTRKPASAGSEIDLTWPALTPKRAGRVIDVADGRIRVMWDGGQQYTFPRRTAFQHSYVEVFDTFAAYSQFLIGVVPPLKDLACPGSCWDYRAEMTALDKVSQYAAVKAAGLQCDPTTTKQLLALVRAATDPRVALVCGAKWQGKCRRCRI